MKKYTLWGTHPYCPAHGNKHGRIVMLPLVGIKAGAQELKGWKCPACKREFDPDLIPMHPPPSRRQWERKFESVVAKANLNGKLVKTHDNIVDGVELYLDLTQEKKDG